MSEPGLPKEPFWSWSRILSLGILVSYLVLGVGRPGELNGLYVGGLPVAIIWFPDFFAEYIGFLLTYSGQPITRETPAGCLVIVAWVILLIPMVWMIVFRSGLLGAS